MMEGKLKIIGKASFYSKFYKNIYISRRLKDLLSQKLINLLIVELF